VHPKHSIMKWLVYTVTAAITTLFFSPQTFAQIEKPIKVWDTRYGGASRDTDVNSIRTLDGGFLLSASSLSGISGNKSTPNQGDDDWWVVKTDQAGNLLWDFNFGGTSEEGFEAGVVQTADDNYVLAGRTRSSVSGDITSASRGGDDILVVKISAADRSVLWQTRLGGNGADWAFDIAETSDGNVVVAGYTASTNLAGISPMGSLDLYLIKLDAASGSTVWERTYGGSGFESADEILANDQGGVVVGAYSASTDLTMPNNGSFDFWTFSTNAAGDVLWENLYGGAGLDAIRGMSKTTDGGYVFTGQSNSNASGNKSEYSRGLDDIWIVKTDASGNLIWEKTLGGDGYDWGQAIYARTDGSFIVGGFSNSSMSGEKLSNNFNESLDVWFIGLDASGGLQWQADFGGDMSDGELNIPYFDEEKGDIYLSGGTQSGLGHYLSTPNFGGVNTDLWFAKYRLHELQTEDFTTCAGSPAQILLGNTISSDFNNKRYQLRNPDGSSNGAAVNGEALSTTLSTGPILSDTTLTVYAITDLPDGSVLEELIGQVTIIAGDELLQAAKLSEVTFDEHACYNQEALVKISNAVEGIIYQLEDEQGNEYASKLGEERNIQFKTKRLKASLSLNLRLINAETGCSEVHVTPILINVDDKIATKISFDRNDLKIGDPMDFSAINDEGIVSWTWTFDKKTNLDGQSVQHVFNRPGVHWISLLVQNANGCTKEISKKLLIKRKVFFGVPGVFWPCTSQGSFSVKLKHVEKENLVIVDDFGKVIHAGKNEWHGFDKRGRLVPAGRYFYRINAVTIDGEQFQKRGSFYVSY
jgi:hypothetical protein